MLGSLHEILFLVAQDFLKLTPIQQVNVGIRLGVVGVEVAMLDHEKIAETVFSEVYKSNQIPGLVREMQKLLYE